MVSGTATIGLPQTGHAFLIEKSTAIGSPRNRNSNSGDGADSSGCQKSFRRHRVLTPPDAGVLKSGR
jgi:hypothetical protein